MFHQHRWEEHERTYAEPRPLKFTEISADPMILAFVERNTMGLTTVTMRCVTCGERKTYVVLGKAV